MIRKATTRTLFRTLPARVRQPMLVLLALWVFTNRAFAADIYTGPQQGGQRPAPVVRMAPPPPQRAENPHANQRPQPAPRPSQNQEHLQQWMQSRGGLSLDQQQRALENEPGFHQLSPDMQVRMHQRLAQLNGMTPEQRQRTYARTEAMERLAPEQRQQVRNALTSLGNLPQNRRSYVAREFRAMRDVPSSQRQAFINSPAMRAQFSDQERQVLSGLFEVSPYLPSQPVPGVPMTGPISPR